MKKETGKPLKKVLPFVITAVLFASFAGGLSVFAAESPWEWAHIQGIGWTGDAISNLRYAQSMGFKYVFHLHQDRNIAEDYERDNQYKNNLYFYVNDPYKTIQPEVKLPDESLLPTLKAKWPSAFDCYPEVPRWFHYKDWAKIKTQYPAVYNAYKAVWEAHFACYDLKADFPDNMAELSGTAQILGMGKGDSSALFMPDFQYQSQIDFWVKTIVDHIQKKSEVPSINYKCTGFIVDMIEILEEGNHGQLRPIGTTCQPHHGPFDYADIESGWIKFLYELKQEMQTRFPDRTIRFYPEPGPQHSETAYDRWTAVLLKDTGAGLTLAQKKTIAGDFMMAESPNKSFLTDPRLTDPKLGWYTMKNLGVDSPQIPAWDEPGKCAYDMQRGFLGPIAAQGAWFCWYGIPCRAGKGKTAANFFPIKINEYPMQIKLCRTVSGWDNLTSATNRSWDAASTTYQSSNSYADANIIYSGRPDNGKIYVTFVNAKGILKLKFGETIADVQRVNDFWETTGNGGGDLTINGSEVSINWDKADDLKSYIITTKSDAGSPQSQNTHH